MGASHPQKMWVPMTAMRATIHVTHAWRSIGPPTSSIGAARRKAKDARATHPCTCNRHSRCSDSSSKQTCTGQDEILECPIFQHVWFCKNKDYLNPNKIKSF